ncbi:MAG: aldose epimerase family protein [Opitutales bacterium]
MSVKVSLSRNPYKLIAISNESGMEVVLSPYGARIIAIRVPDRNGKLADVVLGYNSVKKYLEPGADPCFGSTVGRYAGRIDRGRFSLDGVAYQLPCNDGSNCLHGGLSGIDKKDWYSEPLENGIRFSHNSPDGDNGFPGNVKISVTYTLSNDGALELSYEATSDKATPLNLTNHVYLNLAGEGTETVLNHVLQVNAEEMLPVLPNLIPTGSLDPVENTPFDFRVPKALGLHIDSPHEQLKHGGGYDHTWVLSKQHSGDSEDAAATLYDPESGRFLEVYTTEPGVQVYTSNFLDGSLKGKSGKPYQHRSAACLETQHFPDSPNQPEFPNTILRPEETFESKTVYKFSVRR